MHLLGDVFCDLSITDISEGVDTLFQPLERFFTIEKVTPARLSVKPEPTWQNEFYTV